MLYNQASFFLWLTIFFFVMVSLWILIYKNKYEWFSNYIYLNILKINFVGRKSNLVHIQYSKKTKQINWINCRYHQQIFRRNAKKKKTYKIES